VEAVRAWGFQSVICLLSKEELHQYACLPGGLAGQYRQLGLEVASIPVPPDRSPLLTEEDRYAIAEAYGDLPKPVLVHCNAGVMRSGAAVRYLEKLLSDAGRGAPSDAEQKEILRLIRNSAWEHSSCPLRRGRYGMDDYGRLGRLLRRVDRCSLEKYLDEIDKVRCSQRAGCAPCSLKFLAFCLHYSAGRLPDRHRAYRKEFLERNRAWPNQRDFISETGRAILMARSCLELHPTNTSHFHSLAHECSPNCGPEAA
jgi:protein tyrosine phosphatase (PTP) superfamily phosphohydrolase (DUF442 family)